MTDPTPPAASGARLRVLLLDDDAFMLSVLADLLSDLGDFDIHCETDARRALASLASNPPGLLLCDLSMPDMDGIEFMHAAGEARFRGQIILLSGMDSGVRRSAERLARAHGLQVLGAFKKPISLDQLRAALAPLLEAPVTVGPNLYNVTTHSGK